MLAILERMVYDKSRRIIAPHPLALSSYGRQQCAKAHFKNDKDGKKYAGKD